VWQHLRVSDPRFAVDLPGQWVEGAETESSGQVLRTWIYTDTSAFSPGVYEIGVEDIGGVVQFSEEQYVLGLIAKDVVSGEVSRAELGTFAGHNSLSVSGTMLDGAVVSGVIFIDRTLVYIVLSWGQIAKEDSARFLATFTLD
jgi:hypothetical protein